MEGNVWEWTKDWYSSVYYQYSSYMNPQGPDSPDQGAIKVIRGGSWKSKYNEAFTYTRNSKYLDVKEDDLGFRCVKLIY